MINYMTITVRMSDLCIGFLITIILISAMHVPLHTPFLHSLHVALPFLYLGSYHYTYSIYKPMYFSIDTSV